MRITRLTADGFKNLKGVDISPHEKLNIFCGKNAQGKTNLIEALWLCSGARSFRGTKDKRMIGDDTEDMRISVTFRNSQRVQEIVYSMSKRDLREKKVTLNGVKLSAPSKLFGTLGCVIFTPEDLELSKGSPDKRRQFIDLAVAQIKTRFGDITARYDALIEQRNTLLKAISYGRAGTGELEVWDAQLAQMGAYIALHRYSYNRKLRKYAKDLYREISGGSEELDIEYHSTVYGNCSVLEGKTDHRGQLAEIYYDRLRESIDEDIRAGFTQRGVHRDDLVCRINGQLVREDASQGQHRSVALVMKLAQAYILEEESGELPCILLDDVLSELDPSRQRFVISKIHGMQVFITCCEMNIPFDEESHGKIFGIEGGKIKTAL